MPLGRDLGPETLVDLDRYPIDRWHDPRRAALVERCRRDLAERALCSLPAFIGAAGGGPNGGGAGAALRQGLLPARNPQLRL